MMIYTLPLSLYLFLIHTHIHTRTPFLFTNFFSQLLRIPVSFRTSSEGVEHCHIILAICYQKSKKWGALGISRLGNLMYKPFVHQTLHDLVSNFIASYEKYFHKNVEISLGLPLYVHTN